MKKLTSDILLELHVPDFELAKKFYKDLGFIVVWEKKDEQKKGYLVMRKGESILNFYCGNKHVYEQTYFRRFSKNTKRGYAVEIIIPIDNIKKFYKAVSRKYNGNIVEQLRLRFDEPDFRMLDPFGFYLRFVERYNWVDGTDKIGNILRAKVRK